MKYLTNQQITELYSVSYDAVRGWIQAAQQGKTNLQIIELETGIWRIADTNKNRDIITELVAKGRKHKNGRALKTIRPLSSFYELYSPAQQLDIVSNIETYHEIPLQYTYFDKGADYWDKYSQRVINEQSPNILKNTIALLDTDITNIDRLLGDSKRVNVIDLGVGNGLPVMSLLEHLIKRNVLCRYIGIDISPDMLKIAERNIKSWFGEKVTIETHVRDIATEGFRDLLVEDYLGLNASNPTNVVMLLGGTLTNFRRSDDVLRQINSSMMAPDLLVYTDKLDTPNSRRYFDFNVESKSATLSEMDRWIVDLLGISPDMYDVEQFYDETKRSRFIRIRLKIAISMKFSFSGGERQIDLNKHDTLVLWRAKHNTAREIIDLFDRNGFELLNANITRDHEYLLTISSVAITS